MANLPITLKARSVGFSQLLHAHRKMFSVVRNIDAPLPWWMQVHDKAVDAHRSIDMQLMLATGDDLEAMKERKSNGE